LEIERRRFGLMGKTPAEVTERMKGATTLYYEWLIKKRKIPDVMSENATLTDLWPEGKDRDHLYGRPLAFYEQLQNLNLAADWSKVKVPTLILHGQYDWIMSRDDHELIAQYVNTNSPGAARFVEVPGMGHTLQSYTNWANAFAAKSTGLNQNGAKLIIDWLKDQQRASKQP
jgi:pimeloyl-ACP methyl ester carboxylesterase